MKTKAIIHISDLHIAAKIKPENNESNSRTEKTYLIAQNDEKNNDYIEDFCESVSEHFNNDEYEMYLLITGDIADSSYEEEYRFAKLYLEQILAKLKIDKHNVLIVPGNHDVNWIKCGNASMGSNLQPFEHFEEKYYYFKEFYNGVLGEIGKSFDVNKQVVDYLLLHDEKLLFVGINSNYKIRSGGGKGAVKTDLLDKELNVLCGKYPDEYSKIAVFHHNIVSDSKIDSSIYGSWEENDWINFKKKLDKYGFKIVMFGNEHTNGSSRQWDDHMYMSDSGSFGLRDCKQCYKVYVFSQEQNRTFLKQRIFRLENQDDRPYVKKHGEWQEISIDNRFEVKEFPLCENASVLNNNDVLGIPNSFIQNNQGESQNAQPKTIDSIDKRPMTLGKSSTNDFVKWENDDFQKELMGIIKSEKLYHSGHFHWGENSRSHNWIDTISLLQNRQYNQRIQNEILCLVEKIEKETGNFDAFIGIGTEGNIMSTGLLLKDALYTYLPYTYRQNDYSEFEKKINLTNDGQFEKVMIITDVVNRGRMLKKLITKDYYTFFSKVKDISVISLFFSGRKADFIARKLPEGLGEIWTNLPVKFYPLLSLEMGECPYGENYKTECPVNSCKLSEVYQF